MLSEFGLERITSEIQNSTQFNRQSGECGRQIRYVRDNKFWQDYNDKLQKEKHKIGLNLYIIKLS